MTPRDWNIDPRIENARTPPAAFYLDPAWYEAERRAVFGKSWQLVGRTDQIAEPGDYFTFEVAKEPGIVVRDARGEIRALSNVCRHRASLLLSGSGRVKSVQCPYHAWTYDLSGKLAGAPEFEGAFGGWRKDEICLPRFEAVVWGPLVFVRLGDGAPSFSDWLGNIPGEIEANGHPFSRYRFLTRREYVVRCNWKVYIDNYLEGYHIPPVHPALFRELDYANYRVETFRFHSSQEAPLRPARGGPRRYDPATTKGKPLYYWLFPNTMLNVYPDNLQTNTILPLGPEETLTIFDWFSLPENPATAEAIAAFSEEVQKEDIAICESVARGLRARAFERGRYHVRRENGVHHFHRLWEEAMAGAAK